MQTVKWGKAMWIPLHAITFNYPLKPTQADKDKYSSYFRQTGHILPCKYCRKSYIAYMKEIPIEPFLDTREGVCYWLFTIHNLVNHKLYKPLEKFSDVIVKYEKMRAKCGSVRKNDVKYKSCAKKFYKNVDRRIIVQFLENTQPYTQQMNLFVNTLFSKQDNPNIEAIQKSLNS